MSLSNVVEQSAVKPRFSLSALSGLYEKILVSKLSAINNGQIEIVFKGNTQHLGPCLDKQRHIAQPLYARVEVLDKHFFESIVLGGSVGAAESYIKGEWRCDDLTSLVRILVRNRDLLDNMEGGIAQLSSWLMQRAHSLRKNTRMGSQKNIAEHYDIGNDLFELFLDCLLYTSPSPRD